LVIGEPGTIVAGRDQMTDSTQFPTLGVRVNAFRELINGVCGGSSKIAQLTTSDICRTYIKPLTATSECSYCDYLMAQGSPNVGQANVFISHAWKFKFLDIVEAIEHHFRHYPNAVVWFDLFSNNQHHAPNLGFDWWSTTFKNAIFLFGHTALILYPWEDPIPLTRAWCLWEIYCTIATKSKFEIAMCASERENFLSQMQVNICPLSAMIAHVNVAKSDAYRVEDKERIFSAVEKIEGGFDHVNSVVFQTLRDWVIETMRAAILVAGGDERIYLIGSLAIVYRRYGMYDLAEPCARYACECAINKFGKHNPFTLKCQNELVLLLDKRGKRVEAYECAKLCMEARQRHIGPSHPDTLSSMQVLGNILCQLKRYNEAQPLLTQCYENSRVVLGENHQDTLRAMFALANLYFAEGKYDLAEPLYSRHPDSEHCKHFLMTIHASQGQYEETREYYKSHYEFSRTKLGASHPETLIYMHNLALIYCCMSLPDESIPMFRECVTLRKLALGLQHPDTLQSMYHLGRILQSRGHFVESSQLLEETVAIQRKVLGPDHTDTQATLVCLDEVSVLMPFIRYIVPVWACPIYLVSHALKSTMKSVKCVLNPQLASIEDVTMMYDAKDELSIDEYNARQLTKGGAPLADECPVAAFISGLAPKNLTQGQVNLTKGALLSAVTAALAPEFDNGTDGHRAEKLRALNSVPSQSGAQGAYNPTVPPPRSEAAARLAASSRPSGANSGKQLSDVSSAVDRTVTAPVNARSQLQYQPLSPPQQRSSPQRGSPQHSRETDSANSSPTKEGVTRKGSLGDVLHSLPFLGRQESARQVHAVTTEISIENGGHLGDASGDTGGWSFMNVFSKQNSESSNLKDSQWSPDI
jgi:tetratricopeptide (TPR) repeat protein